jgi:hypothetical protein
MENLGQESLPGFLAPFPVPHTGSAGREASPPAPPFSIRSLDFALGIAWMRHRGYISSDIVTPGLLILGVGVVEYLQAAHLTPSTFLPFALSLWLPGSGLLVLGLIHLATSARK